MKKDKIFAKKYTMICIIYVILTCAVFSDILRIPGTSLTFFRLLLPISLFIITIYMKYAKILIKVVTLFVSMTIIQYILFYRVVEPTIRFEISEFISFVSLYIFIFIVLILVRLLIDLEGECSREKILDFLIYVAFLSMIVTILDTLDMKYFDEAFFGCIEADNQNNYGCTLAAIFPFFLVELQDKKKFRDYIGIVLTVLILFINDSKAALFGVIISGVVFLCVARPANTMKKMFVYRYIILICALSGIVMLIIINPKINGYSLQDTIYQPIIRVLSNRPYPDSASSISFRTNSTAFAFNKLVSTCFFGIGAGNTGVLLRKYFPTDTLAKGLETSTRISLHNSWLEIMLDIGIMAVVFFVIILLYGIRLYFIKKELTSLEKLRTMFIFSFPVWIISTSGFYTLYYVIIVIGYLFFLNDVERK